MNSFRLILICGRNDLDDVIAGEFEAGNFHRRAVHQVRVEDTEDRFMSNNEKVGLLALEFENYGLETDCKIVIGLPNLFVSQ